MKKFSGSHALGICISLIAILSKLLITSLMNIIPDPILEMMILGINVYFFPLLFINIVATKKEIDDYLKSKHINTKYIICLPKFSDKDEFLYCEMVVLKGGIEMKALDSPDCPLSIIQHNNKTKKYWKGYNGTNAPILMLGISSISLIFILYAYLNGFFDIYITIMFALIPSGMFITNFKHGEHIPFEIWADKEDLIKYLIEQDAYNIQEDFSIIEVNDPEKGKYLEIITHKDTMIYKVLNNTIN